MRFKRLVFLITFFMCTSLFSQVNFIHQDLEKAKQEARVEGRYILVDVYTDWCGWCKKMDKTTFHNDEVAKFVNENMVALKLNAEKGIGKELSQKYGVSGLPTIIYLDYKGNLIEKKPGFKTAAQIMNDLEPYKLAQKNKVNSNTSLVSFDQYVENRADDLMILSTDFLSEDNLLTQAYTLGKDKKAFDFDQLKGKNSSSETQVAKMDVFYLLAAGDYEDASDKIVAQDLISEFSLLQSHFLVLTFMKNGIHKVEQLKMINEHCLKTKDLSLLNTKAALQFKIGDIKDANETLSKAKKIAKKNKVELSASFLLLKEIIQ